MSNFHVSASFSPGRRGGGGGGGGGVGGDTNWNLVGMCGSILQTLPHPFPDLASNIHTHFQTWFLESIPVSIKSIHVFRNSDQNC